MAPTELSGCENMRCVAADGPGTPPRPPTRLSIPALFWKAPVSNRLIVGGGGVCVPRIPAALAFPSPWGENPPDFRGV